VDLSNFLPFQYLCSDLDTLAKGNLVGECEIDIPVSNGDASGVVRGRVRREEGRLKVTQSVRIKGDVRAGGRRYDFDIQYAVTLIAIDGASSVTYRFKSKSCVEGRCSKGKDSVDVPIATAGAVPSSIQSESWTLTLDLTTKRGRKIAGTAVVQTESGRELRYVATGRYKRKRDRAKIELEPEDRSSKGTSLELDKVTVTGGIMSADIDYSLFGTRGSLTASSM